MDELVLGLAPDENGKKSQKRKGSDSLERGQRKIARTETSRTETSRTENLRTEKSRTEKSRTENSRTENLRTENLRTENLRTENSRTDNLRTEKSRTDNLRTEKSRTDNLRTDKLRTEGRMVDVKEDTDDEEYAPPASPQYEPSDDIDPSTCFRSIFNLFFILKYFPLNSNRFNPPTCL